MRTVTRPTIRFKRTGRTVGWSCSCRQSVLGYRDDTAARAGAQAHANWHWDRSEYPSLEIGGLL